MHPSDENASTHLERWVGLLLLVGVTGALIIVLLPFYGPLCGGSIIALLFALLNRRFRYQRFCVGPVIAAMFIMVWHIFGSTGVGGVHPDVR